VAQPATTRAACALSQSFETVFTPFPISFESSQDRVRCKLGKCWSPYRLRSYLKTPIYSDAYSANFQPQVKNSPNPSSHQIRVFRHQSKQLVSREARRELEEALEPKHHWRPSSSLTSTGRAASPLPGFVVTLRRLRLA
jgi:hypothetical protein